MIIDKEKSLSHRQQVNKSFLSICISYAEYTHTLQIVRRRTTKNDGELPSAENKRKQIPSYQAYPSKFSRQYKSFYHLSYLYPTNKTLQKQNYIPP